MEYKWITQDMNGDIVMFEKEPFTDDKTWWNRLQRYKTIRKQETRIENWKSSLINLETHDYKIEDGILKQVEKTQRCKYADVFIEAANDKTKVLQARTIDDQWYDLIIDENRYEYRIKPEKKVIKYRNYLTKQGNVKAMNDDDGRDNDWIEWIGDWQEAEV